MGTKTHRRRLAFKLGLLLAGTCVLVVILGEVFIKLYYFGWHESPKKLLLPSDSLVLVYELQPGARVTTKYLNPEQRDWEYTASINEQGFRGNAVDIRAPKPRIIVLGDSFTFGYGVDDDETFSAVLERELGGKAAVLNWGVPGYNLVQDVELLKRKGEEYKPDIVIVAQHFNDFDPKVMEHPNEVRYVLWSHLYSIYRHIKFVSGEDFEVRLERTRKERVQGGFEAFDAFARLSQEWDFEPILFRSSCRGGYDEQEMDQLFVRARSAGVTTVETDYQFCDRLSYNSIPDDWHPTVVGHQMLADELLPHVQSALRRMGQ